jgi:defect-in-organelle-trafficking protein DotB
MTDVPMISLDGGYLPNMVERGIDMLFRLGASDITIQSDDYIWAYVNRQHRRVSNRRLDDGEVQALVRHLYGNEGAAGMLGSGKGLDFDADLRPFLDADRSDFDPDFAVRCRVNVTRCRVGTVADASSITLRTIPGVPPRIEALNLPREILDTIFPSQGLVLVVGITGSGKSTLLASCNRYRLSLAGNPLKIITIEDPIEYVYPRLPAVRADDTVAQAGQIEARMPEVSQVQLYRHLADFGMAAPNILRRKGDVIVMGEMRGKGSVDTGLLLAQTGHCTYATLHCETPAQAVARVVSEYAYEAQPAVANKLLDNLRLIVAQKIERDVNGKGKAFRSWCVFDQAFKARLAEQPYQKWSALIQRRMEERGHTFAMQALPAFVAGEISLDGFSNLAGFNPIETREFLSVNAPGALPAESPRPESELAPETEHGQ